MDKLDKYKPGIQGIRYKPVHRSWRKSIDVRTIRNRKKPTNPMVLDLLAGKTIFAYKDGRNADSFGSLYAVAASNGKVLRMYQTDDLDDEVYKGLLIWMESPKRN
jgi:hypothetical protein